MDSASFKRTKKAVNLPWMNFSFTHFKSYANFLLQNHVDALAKDIVEKARQANIPLLKYLSKFSEQDIEDLAKKGIVEDVLMPILQDTPFEKQKRELEQWKSNKALVSTTQVSIEDITSANNVRKLALFDFISHYDVSKEDSLMLVKEITVFFETCVDLGLDAYEKVRQIELTQKSDMLAGILANTPVIVSQINKQGTILYVAGAGLKPLGLKEEELTGKNIFESFPSTTNTRKALEGGKPINFIDSIKSIEDGKTRQLKTFYVPDKGNVLGFSIDITEQREAEERFRLLVSLVRDYAIFGLNTEGTIISWNEGAKRLKGYTEDEIVGKHFSIFYPEEKKREKFPEYELEQARLKGRFEDEGIRVKKDGSTFYANVVITALYDNNHNLVGFSKITRDLTERKQYEENLHRMNLELEKKVRERTDELYKSVEELRKINNDLDNFIYTASHDLKAPVSNIEGLINGLFEELNEEAKQNVSISTFKQMIDSSINRFQSTIKELTEIAKIQKGAKENMEDIDLEELLTDIKISIADLISKNNTTIIEDIDKCRKIKFVRKNLKSIFYNLISNGIKYRSADREPVITIRCETTNSSLTLTVQDNGLGIKAENIDKVFTMFKRFHDHVEGTGIGLYIVKRIIENAGGTIAVESEEGIDSIFKIQLPTN